MRIWKQSQPPGSPLLRGGVRRSHLPTGALTEAGAVIGRLNPSSKAAEDCRTPRHFGVSRAFIHAKRLGVRQSSAAFHPATTGRSGIALIIVLVIIVALGILAGGFAYTMKVETKLARNASFDVEFE